MRRLMNTNPSNASNTYRQGLTLLELLIVLTILIALGGIVVASLPGLLERTQAATAAANVSEIDSAIRRGLLTNQGTLGNRFDSLISSSSAGQVAAYLGGNENFRAGSLSTKEVEALAGIGVTQLVPADDVSENVTFDSHIQQEVEIGTEAKVCELSPEYAGIAMYRLWNIEPNANLRYIVFGLGQRCTLVGGGAQAVFKEAPVHFSEDAASNPKKMYSRYLLIVEIDNSSELESKARYVGTAIPHQSGIIGINEQLEDHYSNQ